METTGKPLGRESAGALTAFLRIGPPLAPVAGGSGSTIFPANVCLVAPASPAAEGVNSAGAAKATELRLHLRLNRKQALDAMLCEERPTVPRVR